MNILDVVKHRYPFILVDKVLESEYMKYSKVLKNVSYNEPWVPGHYPEHPIMPGVLLIEAMGQASGFILVDTNSREEEIEKKYGYLTTVEKTKFIKPVHPGDQLIIESRIIEHVNNFIKVNSVVKVDGKTVTKGVLSYILQEEKNEL
ncbi:MAG: 3-hydroxyacyl-ACP dehydratase FabZ [Clostridium sp.]|uniref:3-hydroxyacyl-ACP dehydratase FabZ n=1 Tax=Clostridium sp. DSM 8431 TaxID=1761781 RepID=UPI0008F005A7|nr:3-hydroxyacyl-ACP dehydratase FabZ [Clostridium sp. DSM 8431]MCR4945290.1 3-hydroxyacyl-ACP dehydratase FabZ [Clostridium sp.]SFU34544.1 3-hydroxyacyl-[acyl-carrier-protein] dehydratase [Clostridium sp. DSM 8431]